MEDDDDDCPDLRFNPDVDDCVSLHPLLLPVEYTTDKSSPDNSCPQTIM